MTRIPSDLTDTEWEDLARDYREGMTSLETANKYDLNPSTLASVLPQKGITRGTSVQPLDLSDAEVAQQVRTDRQIEKLTAEASHYHRIYNAAKKTSSTQEVLVSTMKDAVTALEVRKQESIHVPSGKASGTHTAVLLLSDLHVGEVVTSDAMDGLSEYNLDVFRQRVGLWVQKVLYLVDLRRSRLEIPRLVILADGDFVSGEIHDELVRTNQTDIVHQTIYTAELMAYAIAEVSKYFEEVMVSCTIGNHGRNQKKFEFKEPHVNWDYICYQHMAGKLAQHEHIKFEISKSMFQITDAENLKILHMHGHGIRGWGGFPWYGVSRAVRGLREVLAMDKRTFDVVAMGHFHVPMEVETPTGPWLINGCWKGGDEFALGALHAIIPPLQTLFFVHSRYGVIGKELIKLEGQTEKDAEFLPFAGHELPGVWAAGE